MNRGRVAVVTGASAGIGEATARRLAAEGFGVVLGARRIDRVTRIAEEIGGVALELDVRDPDSVKSFCSGVETCHVLVNNAGLASGLDPLEQIEDEKLITMFETNVLGLVRVTRELLPKIEASGNGHIVNMGSIAGYEAYVGGGGYTASKHAVRALTRTLRLELLGKPIRVTEIMPGLVKTEFSLVRFDGDEENAERPYRGLTPLGAEDVADCVAWAVTRPEHVNVDVIEIKTRDQAAATVVVRRDER